MAVEDQELTPANSSTDTQDVQSTPESTETGSNPSSEPEGGKFDLLSVVRDAVTKTAEDSASPAGQEGSDTSPTGAPASAQNTPSEDDENFSDVPFHKHPRFQAIVKQRNELREKAQTYETNAKRYENVETFLQTHGMTGDEAAEILELRALMKTNPAEAWKALKPIVQQLLVDAGEVLPQDLHARVQKGEMTKAAAIEISRLRAAQASGQRAQEAAQQQAQQRQVQERQNAIMGAVTDWEKGVKLKDPDYAALEEDVKIHVVYLQRTQGMPSTPEAARKMVEEAYATVKKRRAPTAQPRQPVTPIRGGRVASGQPSEAPKSMLDIVRANRATG
jgi:hypothetical protein